MPFKPPIPFSPEELAAIRLHFKPDDYNPDSDSEDERNKNRIWAAPVRDVLIPKFTGEVSRIQNALNSSPSVALVLVGNDPGSRSYVTNLEKLLGKCGIERKVFEIKEREGQEGLDNALEEIGRDTGITGVICQLPLPSGFDEYEMRERIPAEKDIDVLNPGNAMKFIGGIAPLLPATVGGVAMALQTYGISLTHGGHGKEIAILGQGALVGTPLNIFFTRVCGGTVYSANENTSEIIEKLRNCDIIVSGTRRINLYDERIINPERKQALLDIDFGYENRVFYGGFTAEAHRLAYASMRNPGGSGLFTQLAAVHNILTLCERKVKKVTGREFELYPG